MDKELSIPQFVDALLRRISVEPGCSEVKFDPRARTITFRYAGLAAALQPQNAYLEHRKNPERLTQVLDACVNLTLQALGPAAVTVPADFELIPMSVPEASSAAKASPAAAAPKPAVAAVPAVPKPQPPVAIPFTGVDGFELTPMFADKAATKAQPAKAAQSATAAPSAEQQTAAAAERDAAVLKKKREDMAATVALSMQMDAEELRTDFRESRQIEFDYSTEGMRTLDAWLCQTHKARAPVDEKLVSRLGAFLGQCIVRNLDGSQWILDEDASKLQLGNTDTRINPASVVQTLWVSGPDKSRPTLLQFYEVSVYGKTDAPGWGALPPPLPKVAAVAAAIPGAAPAAPATAARAATPAAAAPKPPPPGRNPLWVDTYPSDQYSYDTLGAIGASLAEMRKNPISLTGLIARNPPWMSADDPLCEVGRNQVPLLAEGDLVWAALVRADKLMFKSGPDDYPVMIVYSRDRHFDGCPQELQQIGVNLLRLKEAPATTPELREATRLVNDEQGRSMDKPVPAALTDKDVRMTTCIAFRRHLPHGALVNLPFPLLIHPQTQAVMIAPAKTWPDALRAAWEPDERTYDRLRALPVGMRVSCSPNPISAQASADGSKYSWPMRTTVEPLYPELTVFEFGLFVENRRGVWTLEGDPFDARSFAERHRCPGGVIKKGEPVQGAITQTATEPRARHVLWYYLAKDPEGKTYRGDCVVEELAPPPPPPPAAPEPEPKITKALWGSLKNAIGAGEAPEPGVRYDGVYKGKPDGNDTHWLRLCDDGSALLLISSDRPKDLEQALQPNNRELARGSYKVMGERIYIDISNPRFTLTGSAHKPQLQLDLSNAKQKTRVKFSFVGWV